MFGRNKGAATQLRETNEQLFRIVARLFPDKWGMARIRVIQHFYNLKFPPVGSAKKTKRNAWHAVRPAGSKNHLKPLCSMQLRLFCGEF
jgi:hypothetical protein